MNLHEFLNSTAWQGWDSDNRSPGSANMILSDPERFDRCYRAAENGAEGSTHGEIIEDWRDAVDCAEANGLITAEELDDLLEEIKECEDWHIQNGSIDDEVG
jgi:hypothetical protein